MSLSWYDVLLELAAAPDRRLTMGELAENTRLSFEEAAQETAQAKPSGGIMGAISMLSKPETQKSLAFLLAFSNKLQARTR